MMNETVTSMQTVQQEVLNSTVENATDEAFVRGKSHEESGIILCRVRVCRFVVWLIYAFLRVHSVGALVFALLVMGAMAFQIVQVSETSC